MIDQVITHAGRKIRHMTPSPAGLIRVVDVATGLKIRALGLNVIAVDYGGDERVYASLSGALRDIARAEAVCTLIRGLAVLGGAP